MFRMSFGLLVACLAEVNDLHSSSQNTIKGRAKYPADDGGYHRGSIVQSKPTDEPD